MTTTSTSDSLAILKEVRSFIVDNFLFGEDRPIDKTQSFLQTNLIDSTGILELIQFLEETYGITVADEEMVPENLDSLDNVSRFVVKKRGG